MGQQKRPPIRRDARRERPRDDHQGAKKRRGGDAHAVRPSADEDAAKTHPENAHRVGHRRYPSQPSEILSHELETDDHHVVAAGANRHQQKRADDHDPAVGPLDALLGLGHRRIIVAGL